jgi:hypothetical protein
LSKRLNWVFAGLALTLIVVGVALSPSYLAYETPIAQSDTVIVLVGADDNIKLRKTIWIMDSGYSNHLLIPGKDYTCDASKIQCIRNTPQGLGLVDHERHFRKTSPPSENLPWYYERTHHELILARQMMEDIGLNSAIIISSSLSHAANQDHRC